MGVPRQRSLILAGAYFAPGIDMVEFRWHLMAVRLAVVVAKSPSYSILSPPTESITRFFLPFVDELWLLHDSMSLFCAWI